MLIDLLEKLCRIPPQPESPPGDEHSTQVFRASPRLLTYKTLVLGIAAACAGLPALTPAAIGIFTTFRRPSDAEPLVILGAVLLFFWATGFGLAYLAVRLDYRYRWYLITDRSLRVREGVFIVREMTVTFANVQNVSTEQGPLQRAFGIADVKVDTAGGGSAAPGKKGAGVNLHTAWLRGLEDPEAIVELIRARLRGTRDAGLGDLDDHASQPPLTVSAASSDAARHLLAEARALRQTVEKLAG